MSQSCASCASKIIPRDQAAAHWHSTLPATLERQVRDGGVNVVVAARQCDRDTRVKPHA
jgi:hypothetical protein